MADEKSRRIAKIQHALTDDLNKLETLLGSPIVPGELPERLQRMSHAFEEVCNSFAVHKKESHESQLEEIASQDAELLSRIENLREEDAEIETELARIHRCFKDLSHQVENAEDAKQRDEGESFSDLDPTIQEALALVLRIRKQDQAIQTWHQEAFVRDRGIGD